MDGPMHSAAPGGNARHGGSKRGVLKNAEKNEIDVGIRARKTWISFPCFWEAKLLKPST
jgi:hypothetical protein